MVNQDEDHYLNLPRRELQWLCKKHGLSANKTNSQLAELLISFYKGQDAGPAPTQEERSSEEVLPSALPASDLKLGVPLKSLEEPNRGKGGDDKMHPQTVNCTEISSHGAAHPLDELSDTSANVICTHPSDNRTTESFRCSSSNPRNKEAEPMSHLEAITVCSKFGSGHEESGVIRRKIESLNHGELRNFDGHLSNPTNNRVSSIPQIQCRNIEVGARPVESGVVSSSEASMEAPPASFQFFVRSEEGINLHVDLSSSPSDWVKRLRDEVCMYRKVHRSKPRVLHRELGCLGDGGECMKTKVAGCPETSLQTKGIERNIDSFCMKSSLSSTDVETSDCGAHCQDAANEPSSSNPINVSGHPGEDKRVVSSSLGKSDSDVQIQVRPTCALPQNSAAASVKMTTTADRLHCPNSLECRTSKSTSSYHKNAEAQFVGISDMVSSVSEKNSLPLSGETCEGLSPHDLGCLEKHSEVCQGSSAGGTMEMHLLRHTAHCDDASASPHQFGGQPEVDSPLEGMPSGKGRSGEHQPDDKRCSSPIAEAPTSAFPEEQGRGALVNEKESSDFLQFDNPSGSAGKRTHDSEFPEELQSKRQCGDGQNHDNAHTESTMKNLRSSKNLAREQLPPRRSKRLVPKVEVLTPPQKVEFKVNSNSPGICNPRPLVWMAFLLLLLEVTIILCRLEHWK
ncbi:uncharacterized protein LOC131246375 isoform X3 [Magnolia sinica]|uniref:uncharacterized protein LOC131246375 isoform X3 n=1 Tax=Magnolia sinica TaxID=86752 RepID=UPI00265ADE4E|nr:uncharacterized protein LOC131246375 isoform X3 [Magnolia sinica]